MRNSTYSALVTAATILFGVLSAHAQSTVFIPDTNFRNFLTVSYPEVLNPSGDSLYTDSAAAVAGSLSCAGQNIADLSGIEWFINIQWLYCYNNQLTSIPDLSNYSSLKWLHCYENQLTSLPDLSTNTSLQQLYCNNNQLTSLPDLTACKYTLQRLYCEYNQLQELPDLSSNYALERLYCNDNLLTSLPDLWSTSLQRLYCWRNQLTSLPALPDNSLAKLGCDQNQLTSLPDFSGFTALEDLYCNSNQLEAMPDFSSCTSLTNFDCRTNKLDFSDARELRIINDLATMNLFFYTVQKPFGDTASYSLTEGQALYLTISSQDSAISYQWHKDGVAISGETDTALLIPYVSLSDSGIYTCRSYGEALLVPPMAFDTGVSEFESEEFTVVVHPITAVQNYSNEIQFLVSPNPASDKISLYYSAAVKFRAATISLLSMTGQEVYATSRQSGNYIISTEITVSDIPAGVYLLRVATDKDVAIQRIIIE